MKRLFLIVIGVIFAVTLTALNFPKNAWSVSTYISGFNGMSAEAEYEKI